MFSMSENEANFAIIKPTSFCEGTGTWATKGWFPSSVWSVSISSSLSFSKQKYKEIRFRQHLHVFTMVFPLPSPCPASFRALSVNAFRWRIREERPGDFRKLSRTTWPETHRPRIIMRPRGKFSFRDGRASRIECFHSRGQHLCKFIGTKESVCIRKEFNSQRTGLGHQHGCRFFVLGHQYGRRDVMWKHSIREGRS